MKRDGIDREKNDRDINIAKLKGSDLINDIKKKRNVGSQTFVNIKGNRIYTCKCKFYVLTFCNE